jgi:DNA-binding response OmpR family regulator
VESVPRRVLVIEDDPSVREVVSLALTWEGYTVTAVVHGGEALEALEAFIPHVILADLALPEVDGRAFIREYRRRGGTAPVLVTTGHAGGFNDLEGVADVFVKPYDLDALLASIERHASQARGAQDAEDARL